MYFTGDDAYNFFRFFSNSLTLDNEKVTSSTSTGISPGKINLFDSVFEPKGLI